jgi:hypothetical protein
MYKKEGVEGLMDRFLRADQKEEAALAERELVGFSKSEECLEVCLSLVCSQNAGHALLASKFIKDRLQFNFYGTPESTIVALHEALVRMASQKLSVAVVSNLSLAVVFIYMRWFKKIGHLLDYLQSNFGSHVEFMLQVLGDLPWQLENRVLVIDT